MVLFCSIEFLPLCPTYIGERRTTFAKACGIKGRCYGEYVGEQIGSLGNILGTHWELSGYIVRTHWNQGKMKKNPPPAPPNLKGKKQGTFVHAWAFPLAAWNFSPKRVHHHFGLGWYPLQKTHYLFNTLWISVGLKVKSLELKRRVTVPRGKMSTKWGRVWATRAGK
jgi:hypothetical protein